MSASPILVPASLMLQFLANEKMASRHWLQCQMECLLDQVFDQLSAKFEDYLASNAITGTAHHTTIDTETIQHQLRHEPLQEHFQPQFQANISHFVSSELPVNNVVFGQSQNGSYQSIDQVNPDGIYSSRSHANHHHQTIYDQTQYPPSLTVTTSSLELSNQNDANEEYCLDVGDDQLQVDDIDDNAAQKDSDEPEVITEFDDSINGLITTEQMSTSLSAPHSNEQLNHNSTNEVEDEDDCDCDDCRNEIEIKEEGDDDEDGDAQFIENDDGPSRPAKIPRIDTTESNRQSSSLVSCNQTEQVQSNNEPNGEADETNEVNNKFITISLQCHHTGCSQMFNNKTELNQHMSTQHDILPYRCLVKHCNQSFSTKDILSGHIKQVHLSTIQWHCNKCEKHFSTYRLLSTHSMRYHQVGQFNCTYPDCSFTGAYKQKVYDHYAFLHKVETTCHHRDCGRRCKWPSCGFASTKCGNTITHIKRRHLAQNSQTNEQPLVDPREYLEVLPDLL